MDSQNSIVVGVTAREQCDAALRFAVEEARRRGLPVRLVHVVHPLLAGPTVDLIAVTRESVLQRATQMLDEVASEARVALGTDAGISTQLTVGHPAAVLAEAADAGALVVLQPERTGVRSHIPTLSVTSSVAGRARGPVVAVPAGWSRSTPARVTVAVDVGGPGERLLQSAFEEAASRGVPLRVVHAWHYSVYDDTVFAGDREQEHSDELAARIRPALEPLADKFPEVDVDLVVHHAYPADALVAESGRTSLLVIGRHRAAHAVGRHVGSTVRAVLQGSRCPVMVVEPDGAATDLGDLDS